MGAQIVEQPGVLDRFLREIRAVARLRHPNIVSAYAALRCGASLVFAMEYVEGLDLRRMVKARGPMPIAHACYFVHQAALGLQHAHEEGIADLLTQACQRVADGRLAQPQGGGRLRGAAGLHDSIEDLEQVEIEVRSMHAIHRNITRGGPVLLARRCTGRRLSKQQGGRPMKLTIQPGSAYVAANRGSEANAGRRGPDGRA